MNPKTANISSAAGLVVNYGVVLSKAGTSDCSLQQQGNDGAAVFTKGR